MKTLYITIMMAAMLTACGHRASNGESTDSSDSIAVATAFQTDSIGMEREDTMVSVRVSVDWPVSGSDSLVSAIRLFACERLATNPMQEGKPEVTVFDDGKKAVETTVDTLYNQLLASWKEMTAEGVSFDGMQFSALLRIRKLEETDRYITYLSNMEGFQGGAHGYATSTGQTFRKRDGMRIGYRTEFNRQTEKYEMKDQTLFSNPQSPKLAALIKEGVRSYFKDCDQDVATDEALSDQLLNVDVNHIPLPSDAPTFSKKGLSFVYQQYEIAPYAAGMVNFFLPYQQVAPLLTPAAAELIEE